MNTKLLGDKTTAFVLAKLIENDKIVLLPFGDNQRYDLVIDENGKFLRIQCKTGHFENGTIRFKTCSTYSHRGRKSKSYHGEIDLFAVVCEKKMYLIPVDEVGNAEGVLRIDSPKNNQQTKIRWAQEYEFK